MKAEVDSFYELEPREKIEKRKNPFKKKTGKKIRREYVKGWKKHDKEDYNIQS